MTPTETLQAYIDLCTAEKLNLESKLLNEDVILVRRIWLQDLELINREIAEHKRAITILQNDL